MEQATPEPAELFPPQVVRGSLLGNGLAGRKPRAKRSSPSLGVDARCLPPVGPGWPKRSGNDGRRLRNRRLPRNHQKLAGSKVVEAAPPEIVSGGHVQTFADAIDRYKTDLYPADGKLDINAVQRVIASIK